MRLLKNLIKYFFIKLIKKQSLGTYIKNVCESMGIIYIKLAQILSTRNDILFNETNRLDLSTINDKCNKIDFQNIKSILDEEYQNDINTIFKSIDENPIGSASVSQVHKAILLNGDIVAIKIKRKDLTQNVNNDIKLIKRCLKILSIFSSKVKYILKTKVIDYYIEWILEEIDFENEKRNIIHMNEFMCKLNNESDLQNLSKFIPIKVYENLCTKNIIVMEFIPHKTINQMTLDEKNKELIRNALNEFLQKSFFALLSYDNFIFHGDPHSGNMFIDDDGNLGFLDYGLVFKFNKNETNSIKNMGLNIFKKDFDGLYKCALILAKKYGYTQKEQKEEIKFKKDLEIYLNKIDTISLTNWFKEMAFVFLNNNLYAPKYFYGFAKAFVLFDGMLLFSEDEMSANDLISDKFLEYIQKNRIKSFKKTVFDQILINKKLLKEILNESKQDIKELIDIIISK